MNEEVIKNYERDLHLFCRLAAGAQIEANEWSGGDEAALCLSSRHAFELAAKQMHYRLELLQPSIYSYSSLCEREDKINSRIAEIIKEKTDHEQKTQPLS